MKHILILEDNPRSLAALQKAIRGIDNKIKICAASSVQEACFFLYDYRIDLFILDAILKKAAPGNTSGIRFAMKVRTIEHYKFTPIIFITALADPKLYAFRNLHSYAYLEKPFDMNEALELISMALEFPTPEEKRKVEYFRKDGILLAVRLEEVMYAEVCQRSMQIHMVDETIEIPYLGMKQFLKQSQMRGLVQCSRSAVVNIAFIRSIDLTRRYVELWGGARVEIGSVYAKRLRMAK